MSGLSEGRDRSVANERKRLVVMVRLAATAGGFSPKLAVAVDNASDPEVRVMADLIERGLSIPDLVAVLQGAHLMVGDEELYDRWIFPTSRKRLSSHHRGVDKEATPDYGLDGPLVRESLHGRAPMGTWMQLERTKATFQWGKLPSWHDVLHIRDFVIYRITGKNVGPWGLSAHVDTRPMLLRPPHSTTGRSAGDALAAFATRRHDLAGHEDHAAAWSDILTPEVEPVGPAGDLFEPPDPLHPEDLLPDAPFKDEFGPGLFGSLDMVRASAALPSDVTATLDSAAPGTWLTTPAGSPETVTIPSGGRALTVHATVLPYAPKPVFVGIDEETA